MTEKSSIKTGDESINKAESTAKLRKRLKVFFIVLLASVVVLFLLLTSRLGTSLAIESINTFLSKIDGAPQIRAQVELDILSAGININKLSVDFPTSGSIYVERLYMQFKPFKMLQNRLVVEKVEVESPQINWDLDYDKENVEARELKLPDLPFEVVVKELKLSKGDISLESGKDQTSYLDGISLVSLYDDGKYNVKIETGSGQVMTDKVSFPLNFITAQATYADQILYLSSLKLFLPDTTLSFSGRVDSSNLSEGAAEINLEIPLAKISAAVPDLPKLSGQARLKASIKGGMSSPQISGTLEVDDGMVDWVVLEDAKLRFDLNKERLILDNSELFIAKGKIKIAKGKVAFADSMPAEVVLELDGIELGHILSDVSVLHSKVMQYQSGTMQMKGTIKPLKFLGSANLDVGEHRTYSVGYKNRSADTLIVSTPKGKVKAELFTDNEMFEIRNGTAAFGSTVVKVKTVQLRYDTVFHMEFVSDMFHFKDAGKIVGLDVAGRGALSCTIDVGENVVITGKVDAENLSIEGFKLGNAKFDVLFKRDILAFKNLKATKNKSVYYGGVSFNFTKTPLRMSYEFSTDSMKIKDLVDIIGFEKELGPLLSGRMVGNATMSGYPGNFNGEARLVFPEFSTTRQKFDNAKLEAKLVDDILQINKLLLKKDQAELVAKGTIKHFDQLDIRVASEGWQVEDLDFIQPVFENAKGSMQFDGKIKGRIKDPLIQAQAIFGKLKVGKRIFNESELHLELTPKYMDLNGKLFAKQLQYSLVFQFAPVNRLDINATADGFEYPYFLAKMADLEIDAGKIDMKLNATVPFSKPKKAKGKVVITKFNAKVAGVNLKPENNVEINLEKGAFKLQPVSLKGAGVTLDGRGDVGFDGKLTVFFKGQMDWRVIAPQIEMLEDAQGLLGFDFSLNGYWEKLLAIGVFEIKRSRMKLANVDTAFENVRGRIHVDVNRINVDDLRFKYGGGEISVTGFSNVAIPEMDLGYLDMRLDLNKVGVLLDQGIMPQLSGQLTLAGKPWPLDLTGRLTVDELRYVQDIKWQKKLIADKIVNLLKPKKHVVTAEQKPRVNFNIEINAPDTIVIRNNLARLEMTADLKLTGNDLNIGLLNTISTDRGFVYFEQNEFDVIRFMVEFTEKDRIYPNYDILAETTVTYMEDETEKNVLITLQLNGDPDNMELKLDSDSGFSHSDIIMLLLVGQPASVMKGDEGMATGLSALSSLSGVNDEIKNRFKLDEFRLISEYSKSSGSSSTINIVPRLVIGKEIAENIFITYSTSLAEQNMQNDQRFEIKYKLKNFTLSAEWDADSTQQYGNFGADLKYHIDF